MEIQFIQLRKPKEPIIKECSKCGEIKPIDEFKKGYRKCRECLYKHNYECKLNNYESYIDCLIEDGILKSSERYAAILLLRSCISRWEACRYGNSIYKDVECDYPSAKDFFHKLLKKKGFFKRWKQLSDIYERTQNDDDRPTIDRIDSGKGYELSNIRALTNELNRKIAKTEPIVFVLHEKSKLRKVVKDKFDSIADIKRYIKHHYPDVNANLLVEKAINTAKEQQGERFIFNHCDKDYYIQILYLDKLSDWYEDRIEKLTLKHIEEHLNA